MEVEKHYTPSEVAKLCDVNMETVYAWINDPDVSRRLHACDLSGVSGRPRWGITRTMIDDFYARRSSSRRLRPRATSNTTRAEGLL